MAPPFTPLTPAAKLWSRSGARSGAGRSGTTFPEHDLPVVAPSAPGNRPNRLSNVRFSLIRKTMWRIFSRASAISSDAGEGAGVGALVVADPLAVPVAERVPAVPPPRVATPPPPRPGPPGARAGGAGA